MMLGFALFVLLAICGSYASAFQFGFPRIVSNSRFSSLKAHAWESNWEVKSMTKDDFTSKIANVVVDQLSIEKDQLKLETDLMGDLKADSVDMIAIATNLENEIGQGKMRLPAEKFGSVKKYGDLLTIIYNTLLEEEKK